MIEKRLKEAAFPSNRCRHETMEDIKTKSPRLVDRTNSTVYRHHPLNAVNHNQNHNCNDDPIVSQITS